LLLVKVKPGRDVVVKVECFFRPVSKETDKKDGKAIVTDVMPKGQHGFVITTVRFTFSSLSHCLLIDILLNRPANHSSTDGKRHPLLSAGSARCAD